MTLAIGKQFLADPAFEQGWSTSGDGGSRAWSIPPLVGYDETEWGYTTREDVLANMNMDVLEVQPSFESWQVTPGHALRASSSYAGGEIRFITPKIPISPTRRYVISYRKKIIGSDLHGRAFVRVSWFAFNGTTARGWNDIGRDDFDYGGPHPFYAYEEELRPPGVEDGWADGSYYAQVQICFNGAGGGGSGAFIDALIDDVRFSILSADVLEQGAPLETTDPSDEVGGWLYDALAPLQAHEDRLGYPLLAFCLGIGAMFQPVYDIVSDPNILLDPDRTPPGWVPWLAQFVGQPLPGEQLPSESPEAYRLRMAPYIKNPPHRRRGTVPAILEEVKKFLVDGANVYAVERQGGNMYVGSIGVVSSQLKPGMTIPMIQARIEEIQPGGRLITVTAITGGDWLSLRTTHTDWADVRTTYTDWAQVKANPTL
jgi:hypothetical protein